MHFSLTFYGDTFEDRLELERIQKSLDMSIALWDTRQLLRDLFNHPDFPESLEPFIDELFVITDFEDIIE